MAMDVLLTLRLSRVAVSVTLFPDAALVLLEAMAGNVSLGDPKPSPNDFQLAEPDLPSRAFSNLLCLAKM
jgi:hypothetical protein